MTQATETVNKYLTAFYGGDFDSAKSVVADAFSFEGPFLTVSGKDAYFEGAGGLKAIVRGHRVLRQWDDGDDVSTIYEVDFETLAGTGTVPMAEWHRVELGRLISGRVLFDSLAFRALVPPAK